MKIKKTQWGVANNFGDRIEVHEDLFNYPKLLAPILQHELKHTDKFFTISEFVMDLTPTTKLNRWDLFKFMIARPKTFVQLLPIWITKKGIVWDINLSLIWGGIIFIVWLILKLVGVL